MPAASPSLPSLSQPANPAYTLCVVVAHSVALFGAGLVSMLRSIGEWDVLALEEVGGQIPQLATAASIIVGDASMLAHALGKVAKDGHRPMYPRVLLVADQDTDTHHAIAARADASISSRASANELIDTIHQLSIANASRSALSPPNTLVRGGLAPGVLKRVREFIWNSLAQHIELHDMAEVAGLSECHFARAFTQSVGISPYKYVMQCRIERAASLIIKTENSFAQIALEVGFCDQSHFTRMFAQQTGETPRAFRRRYR